MAAFRGCSVPQVGSSALLLLGFLVTQVHGDTPREVGASSAIELPQDERPDFSATFFIGSAIDNFAAGEVSSYLNPDASGEPGVFERPIGGVQFAYRLFASAHRRQSKPAGERQLWVHGLTVHGVRSSDVDCTNDPNLSVCRAFENETDPAGRFLYIVRNASSLEAQIGLRWELATLRRGGGHAARAFLGAQAGFATVAGIGEDIVDLHHVGVGLTTSEGRFRDSFLELGYGRSDFFAVNANKRWKLNALLSWWPDGWKGKVSGFARILVDADLGDGADSIQSYFGLRFDLGQLFLGRPSGGGV